ncbi:MAG: hypothetical protein EB145_00890, partial [Proteobacteria bacterium]|nr:hypothetical protein [Pseudomonadota bacterium]
GNADGDGADFHVITINWQVWRSVYEHGGAGRNAPTLAGVAPSITTLYMNRNEVNDDPRHR